MIYFIRSPAGSIKIGTTIRLSHRLRELVAEHGNGLEVLAVVAGSFEEERALHGRFAHLRRVGEWFEPNGDLIEFITSNGKPWDGTNEVQPRRPTPIALTLRAKPEWEDWLDQICERLRNDTGLGKIDRTDVIDLALKDLASKLGLPPAPDRY